MRIKKMWSDFNWNEKERFIFGIGYLCLLLTAGSIGLYVVILVIKALTKFIG
jgi:hypothetical protein